MKIYDMDQHNYAIHQQFKIIRCRGNTDKPYRVSYGIVGFMQVLLSLSMDEHSLTMDELFRIFIDNKAKQHVIMYLDNQGDIVDTIKIELEE